MVSVYRGFAMSTSLLFTRLYQKLLLIGRRCRRRDPAKDGERREVHRRPLPLGVVQDGLAVAGVVPPARRRVDVESVVHERGVFVVLLVHVHL